MALRHPDRAIADNPDLPSLRDNSVTLDEIMTQVLGYRKSACAKSSLRPCGSAGTDARKMCDGGRIC